MGSITVKSTPSVQNETGTPALNTTQMTGDAFGGSFFGAASQLASQASQAYQQRDDKARVLEADNALIAWHSEHYNGPNGYLAKAKGKNAPDEKKRFFEEFEKKASEIMQTLPNSKQQRVFNESIANQRNRLLESSSAHERSELERYQLEQSQAALGNSLLTVANNYLDTNIVSQELQKQQAIILGDALDFGEPPEVTEQKLVQAKSNSIASVINRALSNKDYSYASDFFEDNKENLTPDVRDKLFELINTGNSRAAAQAATDSIIDMGMSERDALAEARKIKKPELRDDVVKRVRERYQESKHLKDQEQAEALQSAADIVEGGSSIDDVPVQVWNQLTAGQRASLENRYRQVKSGVEPVTNWELYTRFGLMKPGEIATVNLLEYRDQLTDAHYQHFVAFQKAAQDAIKKGNTQQLSSIISNRDRLVSAARSAGLVPKGSESKWSKDESQRYGLFVQEVERRLEAFETENERKATGTEKQQIIDQMLLDTVMKSRWLPDKELPIYEAMRDTDGEYYVPYKDIPEADRTVIQNLLVSNGRKVKPKDISRIYAAYRMNNPQLALDIINGK